MTISLTAHIQRRHFADVHKDNKHKSPLIKQFTDGYTADVVPRRLQYYILQLPDVSHQLLPKQSSAESGIWRRKILHKAEEKLHRHVFSLFFCWCEASRAADTIRCVKSRSTYCDVSFPPTGTLLEFTSFTVSSGGYGGVSPVNCRP